MMGDRPEAKGQPGIVPAALFGLCPRCGSSGLFVGIARFAPNCRACGLDYGSFNVGDGPAAFLTLIIGALVTAMALWVDFTFRPPFWVHALLWVPITAGLVVLGLRAGKAMLLTIEYRRKAGEERFNGE